MENFDIVIIGGGYAGVMCALRLGGRLRRRASIAVIAPHQGFRERLRMHEELVERRGPPKRSFALGEILARAGVRFMEDEAEAVERAASRVRLRGGRSVAYRRLVLALGTQPNVAAIPGACDIVYRMEMDGPRGTTALQQRLAAAAAPRVLVIGGGATGIELASALASKSQASVTLADRGRLGDFTTPAVAKRLRRALDSAGVAVRETVTVRAIHPGWADTDHGPIPFDIAVAAAGFVAPPLVRTTGLRLGATGRVLVDPLLRSLDDGNVFVAGDLALPVEPCGAPPRMSAFFALATGAHVADSIADEMTGRRPRPFGFWTWGQAIGLGRHALGFGTLPFDKPFPPYYGGRLGYHLRAFFIAVLYRLLLLESRMSGVPFYLGRRRRLRAAPGARSIGAVHGRP